ncbi:TraX family protein [Lentilactobacillus raoultii]|uniref:TraX family protein n=1 Tax=Lentilactobacillus raoultii TaxID=1987503 RepID=UPI000EFBAF10
MFLETIKRRGLTNFDIKILGITLMFIDHFHEMFAGAGVPTRVDLFGRPVATLFMFLSVEGFTHTHDQKRYLLRLLIGFWVMAIGNMVIGRLFSVGNLGLMNNIFADLFVGVLTMYGIQTVAEGKKQHRPGKLLMGILIVAIPLLLSVVAILLTQPGMPHYASAVVLLLPTPFIAENSIFLYLGPVLYLLRHHRNWQMVAIAGFALLTTGFHFTGLFTQNTQWLEILAIIPLSLYNGQLGKSMKGFFYAFYPLHIWGLYILAALLGIKS